MDVVGGDTDQSEQTPTGGDGPLQAVAVAVGLTAAAVVLSFLGGVAFVVPVLLLELDVDSVPVFLGLSAVGQVGFLAVGYWYARRRRLRVRVARPDAREAGYAAAGVVAALSTATVAAAVLAALDLLPGSVVEEAAAVDPALLLGLAALSVVLVAPAEEFLFRGVVQGRLRQSVGWPGAVAGASLLFGSLHLANYTGRPAAVAGGALLIAAVGSVFGLLYERTGNLTVPVLAHAAYNVVLFVVAYLGA